MTSHGHRIEAGVTDLALKIHSLAFSVGDVDPAEVDDSDTMLEHVNNILADLTVIRPIRGRFKAAQLDAKPGP